MGEFMSGYNQATAAQNPMVQTVLRAYMQSLLSQQAQRQAQQRSEQITPYQERMLGLAERKQTGAEKQAEKESMLQHKLFRLKEEKTKADIELNKEREKRKLAEGKSLMKYRDADLKRLISKRRQKNFIIEKAT